MKLFVLIAAVLVLSGDGGSSVAGSARRHAKVLNNAWVAVVARCWCVGAVVEYCGIVLIVEAVVVFLQW